MFKLCAVFLIVSVLVVLSPADPSIKRRTLFNRFKNRGGGGGYPVKKPDVIVEQKEVYVVQPSPCSGNNCRPKEPEYVVQPNPCSGNNCRPKEPEYVCKSDHCRTCRNDCGNGNDKCHNECNSIDRCRSNCYGNDRCVNECGGNRGWNNNNNNNNNNHNHYNDGDRCRGCGGCPGNTLPALLTHCPSGKALYYVQIPPTNTINAFTSNPEFIQIYNDSNLELTANGIAGRACLTDQQRMDLTTTLNAVIMAVPSFN